MTLHRSYTILRSYIAWRRYGVGHAAAWTLAKCFTFSA